MMEEDKDDKTCICFASLESQFKNKKTANGKEVFVTVHQYNVLGIQRPMGLRIHSSANRLSTYSVYNILLKKIDTVKQDTLRQSMANTEFVFGLSFQDNHSI